MTATKTQPREIVTADELRVGDTLIGQDYDLTITAITEKPKTRVLHIEDTIGGLFEDDYRVRRTTRLYIRARECFAVQGLVDSYGPCINDEDYAGDMDEAHAIARRYIARDDIEWVEIIRCEYPGKEYAEIEYVEHVETING